MAEEFRNTDKNPSSSASHGFERAASATKGPADQALSAGRDLKDKAMEMAGSSTEAIQDHASDFVDAAKDVASQAKDRLKETVEDRKDAGGEYVGSLADTMRRAAREFDHDLPIAGTYIRKAASQVEVASDLIKHGSFDDLVHSTQSFARRQPTAFLGMAVLAGFGVVRFLKSSVETSEGGGSRVSGDDSAARSYPSARRTDNEGYRDAFTK
jgi:hypothetical protein